MARGHQLHRSHSGKSPEYEVNRHGGKGPWVLPSRNKGDKNKDGGAEHLLEKEEENRGWSQELASP